MPIFSPPSLLFEKDDKLMRKWAYLNWKTYLQTENGLADETLDRAIAARSGTTIAPIVNFYNTQLRPGNKEGQTLEPYRNLVVDGIVFKSFEKRLTSLILSQFKKGVTVANNVCYDTTDIDSGKLINCDLSELNLSGMFAPGSDLFNLMVRDASLSDAILSFAKLKNCLFDRTVLSNVYLGNYPEQIAADTANETPELTNVAFQECAIINMYVGECTAQNITFRKSDLDLLTLFEHNGNFVFFNKCEGKVTIGGHIQLDECTFIESTFNQTNAVSGLTARPLVSGKGKNNLRGSTINNATLTGFWADSDFRGCDFDSTFTFDSGVNVAGCDFTGSDINSVYATPTLFKAAVSDFTGAKWTDGSTIT